MAMITSSYTLHPPDTEDAMELSSPRSRAVDNDIEIDFGDDFDIPANGVNDHNGNIDMVDADGQAASTATKPLLDEDLIDYSDDEYLEDPKPATNAVLPGKSVAGTEQPSHQTSAYTSNVLDEDLIDYSDDEQVEPVGHATEAQVKQSEPLGSQQALEPATTRFDEAELLLDEEDDEENGLTEDVEKQAIPETTTEKDATEAQVGDDVTGEGSLRAYTVEKGIAAADSTAENAPIQATAGEDYTGKVHADDSSANDQYNGEDSVTENQVANDSTESYDQASSNSTLKPDLGDEQKDLSVHDPRPDKTIVNTSLGVADTDTPATPTDTGLHPIVLEFNDQEYPLFKSRGAQHGLLKNDNLVSVSIADFIKACRQSLAARTGQEIEERFEMVLFYADLSLGIIEDSRAAFETNMHDVLDLYLLLQKNDGFDEQDIPPLRILVSLQVKFSTSIAILKQSAAEGTGLSFWADESGHGADGHEEADIEEHYQDEGDRAATDNYDNEEYEHYGEYEGEDGEGDEYSGYPGDYVNDNDASEDGQQEKEHFDLEADIPDEQESDLQVSARETGQNDADDEENNVHDTTAPALGSGTQVKSALEGSATKSVLSNKYQEDDDYIDFGDDDEVEPEKTPVVKSSEAMLDKVAVAQDKATAPETGLSNTANSAGNPVYEELLFDDTDEETAHDSVNKSSTPSKRSFHDADFGDGPEATKKARSS